MRGDSTQSFILSVTKQTKFLMSIASRHDTRKLSLGITLTCVRLIRLPEMTLWTLKKHYDGQSMIQEAHSNKACYEINRKSIKSALRLDE